MEPKLPAPQFTPEFSPTQQPEQVGAAPGIEQGIERGERPVEQQAAAPATVVAPPPILPTPIVATPSSGDSSVASDTLQLLNPSVANDDDLIEKEWVDRAKNIIDETRDDPYRREQEIAKLQSDYLRKRYGKELGAADAL